MPVPSTAQLPGSMKYCLFAFTIFLCKTAPAQIPWNGYDIFDWLVTANHPNGCPDDFVVGPPDNFTWVNMIDFSIMTGAFGMSWSDQPGPELLLETSYHTDNYIVRLILSGGGFSNAVNVTQADWIEVPQVNWTHIYANCTINSSPSTDWVVPMDFATFGIGAADIVTGIEIQFLPTGGAPDLAGVYITAPPCFFEILGPDVILCPGETIDLDVTQPDAMYEWHDGSTDPVFAGAGPGVYWVEITSDDCAAVDTIVITAASVTIDLGEDAILCPEEILQLQATTPNATYTWQDGSTGGQYTVTEEGTYSVTVEVNGCEYTDEIEVAYTDLPALDLGPDTLLCDDATLLLDAFAPGATYAWQDQSEDATYTVHSAGTYSVTVTINDCPISDEIEVLYAYPEPVELGDDAIICTGQVLFFNVYTPGATYQWQDGSDHYIYEIDEPGTYWVLVDYFGCVRGDTIEVEYIQETGPELGNDLTLCPGDIAVLDATTPGATYLWQDMSVAPTLQVSNSGTYIVTVSIGECEFIDSVTVTSINAFDTQLGPDTILCEGDVLELVATIPGATYLWQDMTTNDTLIVNQPGTYAVTVTLNQCSANDIIDVQFTPAVQVDLGPDQNLCPGETAILNGFAADASYQWHDNSTDTTLLVHGPGVYAVTVTTGNCHAVDSVLVSYEDTVRVDLGNDTTLCMGQNLVLDATFTGATYQWQDGSTASTMVADQSGIFHVSATVNGCTVSDTIAVSYLTLASGIFGADTTLCEGSTLLLDAQNPGSNYLWQDNSNQSTLSVSEPGVYWVEVSLNQCSIRDSIAIAYASVTPVSLGPDTSLCPGSALLLEVNTPGAIVQWQDLSTGTSLLVTTPGVYWASATVDVCSDSDTIRVSYVTLPVVDLGPDTTLCDIATLLLDAGVTADAFLWQDQSADQTLLVTDPGTYWVDVYVDACSLRDSIDIHYLELSSIALGNDTTLCFPETLTLDVSIPGATYLWNDNSTLDSLVVAAPGLYHVFAFIGNCSAADTIAVNYVIPVPVYLGPDTTLCEGQSLAIDVSAPVAAYTWQDGSTDPHYFITTGGLYAVTVTRSNCVSTDSIIVDYIVMDPLYLGQDTTLCPGSSLLLEPQSPNAAYTNLWSDNSSGEYLLIDQPGEYWLQWRLGACSTTDTIAIGLADAITVDLGDDILLCDGDILVLDLGILNAVAYEWQDLSTASTYTVKETGSYWVRISDPCNAVSDTISVVFENCTCFLQSPNIFTPDGDGINDQFLPSASCALASYQLSIYDRYGGLMFDTQTVGEGWDGNVNGEAVQSGVYVYVLRYAFEGEDENSIYGDVTVRK